MIDEKHTLLIVDDEPSCREAFCVALEDDYNLIEAETGEQALEILQSREDLDLVLLDYLLPPGIDGLEVLERMRGLRCEIPVIFVTGKGSEEVAVEAFRLGVKEYIIKPFKVKELLMVIKGILGSPEVEKSPVDKAIEFMEGQYCKPIIPEDIAMAVGLSYVRLAHLFKMEKECSITGWLNKLRIEKAKLILRDPNLEIKEIAAKVGFNNPNYFYRNFRKFTGVSPTEYRRRFG
jgi:two-component system response regulator YesN